MISCQTFQRYGFLSPRPEQVATSASVTTSLFFISFFQMRKFRGVSYFPLRH
ncbi:MAG: hypothetical protein JWP08_1146 [Bryobacterales bacterium]|nr:hypothetical protein [Bryobacterales bacterium]